MANFITNVNKNIDNDNNFVKIPNNLLTLSLKEYPALTLVYTYLVINRNMLGKTNVSISALRKDIFKTKNQNVVQKKEEDIINSFIILSNCITNAENLVVSDSHIQIQSYEEYFDQGEISYESLSVAIAQMRCTLKVNCKNFVRDPLSIITVEDTNAFVKLTLKEYLTLMSFVYQNPKGKSYKIADLLNIYLLVKSNISKKDSFRKKFSNQKNPCWLSLDKLILQSKLCRETLKKYLDALCDLQMLKQYKPEVKIYYSLDSSIEGNITKNIFDDNGEMPYD